MKLAGHDVFYWLGGRCFFEPCPDGWLACDGNFEEAETEPCEYLPFDESYSVVENPPAYFKYVREYEPTKTK